MVSLLVRKIEGVGESKGALILNFAQWEGAYSMIYVIAKQNESKLKPLWDSSDNIKPPSIARCDHVQQRITVN